jgi:hypothetical protein
MFACINVRMYVLTYCESINDGPDQGCQISLGTIQKRGKMYQMTIKFPNAHNIYIPYGRKICTPNDQNTCI